MSCTIAEDDVKAAPLHMCRCCVAGAVLRSMPGLEVTRLILVAGLLAGVRCELYTCLADMEELLETEALLMRTLEDYITAQEAKLHTLRR